MTLHTTFFAQVPEWVLFSDVSAYAIRLYAVLRRLAEGKQRTQCPSRQDLAEAARCSVDTVDRAKAELVAIGALQVQGQCVAGTGTGPNRYFIASDPPQAPPEPPRGGRQNRQAGGPLEPVGGGPLEPAPKSLEREQQLPLREREIKASSTDVDLRAEVDLSFTAWWEAYPRRNGKRLGRAQTLAAWKRMKPPERALAEVGVQNYAVAVADDLTIAKDPHRWLRGRCWEDWLEPAVRDERGWGSPRASDSAAHCLAMTIQERGF